MKLKPFITSKDMVLDQGGMRVNPFPPTIMGCSVYHGVLPVCRSRAPPSVLELWCKQHPTVVSARTTHTHELPLHCYLASSGTSMGTVTNDHHEYFLAMQFLVEKHPDALDCTNQMGLLWLHLAALQDAALAGCCLGRGVLPVELC